MSLVVHRVKQILFVLATAISIVGAPVATISVSAHQTDQPHVHDEAPAPAPANYDYAVQKSNNLTLLVRRSLQLYDESSDQISLSEAQIVYAETNIVRQLGSYAIDIGQEVSVPADLVAQFAQSSQSLSEAQVAAWGRYARVASFDLSHIQPSSAVAQNGKADQSASDNPAANQSGGDQDKATDASTGTDWWWFAILAAVILSLWYWLRDRDTKPTAKSNGRRKK